MKKSLFLLATLLSAATFAQNSFVLSTYTSEYTSLIEPNPVDLSDDGGEPWDDPFFFVPIGFDFQFAGETYNSTFQLGAGAMMGLGDILTGDNTIHIFGSGDDIVDGTYVQGLDTSIISYETVGAVGDRIFKLEYNNAAFYEEAAGSEPAAENRTNFQLWFYELNGILEIHYGVSNIPNAELVYAGNLGPSTIVGVNYNLNSQEIEYGALIVGDPVNATLNEFTTIPDNGAIPALNAVPQSGRVYRLTPSTTTNILAAKTPEFTLYPTIAQNEIWVRDALKVNATYRILDITGKEVKKGNLQMSSSINVADLNAGIYLVSIDGMSSAAKFIKE